MFLADKTDPGCWLPHPVSLLHLHTAWSVLYLTKRDGGVEVFRNTCMSFVLGAIITGVSERKFYVFVDT